MHSTDSISRRDLVKGGLAGAAAAGLAALLAGFRMSATWQSFFTALVVAIIFFFACLFAVAQGWTPAVRGGEALMSASFMCFKILLIAFIVVISCDLNASVVTTFSVFFVAIATLFMFVMGTVYPLFATAVGPTFYAQRQTVLPVVAFVLIAATLVILLNYISSNEHSVVASSKSTERHGALEELAALHRLMPREVDVAARVLQGYTLKKIAQLLYISEGTVQTHMKNLYRKLELHSKQELITLVDAHGTGGSE